MCRCQVEPATSWCGAGVRGVNRSVTMATLTGTLVLCSIHRHGFSLPWPLARSLEVKLSPNRSCFDQYNAASWGIKTFYLISRYTYLLPHIHMPCKNSITNVLKQVTPVVPMSMDSWNMSFAKFLELRFHGNQYGRRASVEPCDHSLHHDHYQYYGCKQIVASFRLVHVL